ncbi:helix-turn-helix domain-containing protein [Streptomyces sp. ME19-01-6]|uniref:helix-turn-helix domain-containing protein n=1 Tax=Streptomyces sp. ME19-01-6 TaxID=3028686 RepID=UPI0029AC5755|nr:helix-turn-helix domain-containing protein [Streptomyces sp. ME19-01-6]MDX3228319.1 helix-turn-helix domain-containing protein [Streptomyces sp. ME19-01-6]
MPPDRTRPNERHLPALIAHDSFSEPTTEKRPHEKTDEIRVLELGPVRVTVVNLPELTPTRPRRPLLSPTPEAWQLSLLSSRPRPGAMNKADGIHQETGTLMLHEGSQPFEPPAPAPGPAQAVVVNLPRGTVPIPERALRSLTTRPVPPRTGPGMILARFLEGLADQLEDLKSTPTGRLGSAVVDLSVAFLTSLAEARGLLPPHPRRAELLEEIKSFIIRNLGEPHLSPQLIAAEHHISVRYLHHLFQHDMRTVRGFLQEQRLEHCRADLTNPSHPGRTVGVIRARWGFRDDPVFCRAFKKAYGMSPGEYRKRHFQTL